MRTKSPIKHGTVYGYQRHRRDGEEPCEECMAAVRAKSRAAYAKSKAARGETVRQYRRYDSPTGRGLTIEVKCPRCSGPVAAVNQRSMSSEFVALAKCENEACRYEWAVRLVIAHAKKVPGSPEFRDGPSHGTTGGYMDHRRKGEKPCAECMRAHSLAHQLRQEAK